MDTKLQDVLTGFFEQSNVKSVTINETIYYDKREALQVLLASITESIIEGDIQGNVADFQAYQRYVDANKVGLPLFINAKDVEFECKPNQSFAMTTVVCENFGFDVDIVHEKLRENNKERFQQFYELIDYLHITSGPKPNEIMVTFTVNNVWRE